MAQELGTSPVLFFERGYDLFRPRSGGMQSVSNGTPSPALDSFGLYGDLGNTFRSFMGRVSQDFLAPLALSNHFLAVPSGFCSLR